MTKGQIKNFILNNIVTDKGTINSSKTNKNYKFYKQNHNIFDIIDKSIHIPCDNRDVKLSEKIYCYLNDLDTIPLCQACNKNMAIFINFKNGYRKTCSSECANSSDYKSKTMKEVFDNADYDMIQKRKLGHAKRVKKMKKEGKYNEVGRKITKYWIEHPEELEERNNKTKEALNNIPLERKKTIYDRMVETKRNDIDENGVNLLQRAGRKANQTTRNKSKEELDEISKKISEAGKRIDNETGKTIKQLASEKSEKVKKQRYGIGGCVNKEKSKETLLKRYGVDNIFKSDYVKQRIKETRNKKWMTGKRNYFKSCVEEYSEDGKFEIISSVESFIDTINNEVDFKCLRCGKQFTKPIKSNGSKVRCTKCDKNLNKYSEQKEIYEFLEKLDQSLIFNDRQLIKSPDSNRHLEVDIVSYAKKFGIEYDGLIWHSFGMSEHGRFHRMEESLDKKRHLIKTELVEEQGFQLYRIFSNEWLDLNKKDIWQSILSLQYGNVKKIYARKCEIKEVSYSDSKEFLDENHLQGNSVSSLRYGLYYDNELVSLMTFSKARYRKDIEWELMRFVSKKYHIVIGGASKLLTHFERTHNPKSLISYANRRWSIGNLYEKIGFNLNGKTKPNYFYFKHGDLVLQSREKFQKHKLKHMKSYDVNKTESEIMYEEGYRKIYDCGNLIFIKEYTDE